jgi:transposase
MPGPRPKYTVTLTETPAARLRQLSRSDTAPCAEVQRARLLLLAHQHPEWQNQRMAQAVGGCVATVPVWRQRWQQEGVVAERPRRGAPREFPALGRTQVVALACTKPTAHGKVWRRWRGEQLAAVAIEPGIVPAMSARTIRRWLREERIKPWCYHPWQQSADPPLVQPAGPGLDLSEQAPELAQQGEAVWWVDEPTSLQARPRVSATKAAMPQLPVQLADRDRRMGAVHLFGALRVASGITCAQGFRKRGVADCKTFWLALLTGPTCQGLKVLHLILENGSTHAPQQLANWIASLQLSLEVRIYGLPTHASWLDQVESIFSTVQREVLTPKDFSNLKVLEKDFMA